MKIGIIVFPGSNCDQDCHHVIHQVFGCSADYVWHKETSLKDFDAVVLPGGFSYGDYLRCGAIAKFSPIMQAVVHFAKEGRPVLGICNGFQILIEAGLLPGALMRNVGLQFICDEVILKLKNNLLPFTNRGKKEGLYRMPVAHMDGNYYINEEGFKKLTDQDQIVFHYVNQTGALTPEANPNGSVGHIAGISNKQGNVLGMMPHPERVCEAGLGGTDGRFVFESFIDK